MPRLVGPEDGAKEVGIGDAVIPRHKDGTFHVDNPAVASLMRKTGDFTTVGIKINGQGYECQDCGFLALYSDHCGRCDGTNLKATDR
jgi:ribosomal protein S27AE